MGYKEEFFGLFGGQSVGKRISLQALIRIYEIGLRSIHHRAADAASIWPATGSV